MEGREHTDFEQESLMNDNFADFEDYDLKEIDNEYSQKANEKADNNDPVQIMKDSNSSQKMTDGKEEKTLAPPSILDALTLGKKRSATFAVLMQRNGITLDNYSDIISISSAVNEFGGDTDPKTRKIRVMENADLQLIIQILAHEMTNRLLSDKFNYYIDLVTKGKITPRQFADKLVMLEKEGKINQLKVSAEMGYRYENQNNNNLIDKYISDKTTNIRAKILPGTELIPSYEAFGKSLQNGYLASDANIETVQGVEDFKFDSNVAMKSKDGNYLNVRDIYSGEKMKVVRDLKSGKYSKYEK